MAPWETMPGSDPLNFSNARLARGLKQSPLEQAASGSQDTPQAKASPSQQADPQPGQEPTSAWAEEVTERMPALSLQERAPPDQPPQPGQGSEAANANGDDSQSRPAADPPAAGPGSSAADARGWAAAGDTAGDRDGAAGDQGAPLPSRASFGNGDPTELSNVARLLEVGSVLGPRCLCTHAQRCSGGIQPGQAAEWGMLKRPSGSRLHAVLLKKRGQGWRSAPCRHDSALCRLMKPGRTSQQQGARWTPCLGSRRASCVGHDLVRQARYFTNEETAEVHAVGRWLSCVLLSRGLQQGGCCASQVMQAGVLCCSALELCRPGLPHLIRL